MVGKCCSSVGAGESSKRVEVEDQAQLAVVAGATHIGSLARWCELDRRHPCPCDDDERRSRRCEMDEPNPQRPRCREENCNWSRKGSLARAHPFRFDRVNERAIKRPPAGLATDRHLAKD